jgi:hypothetical protein
MLQLNGNQEMLRRNYNELIELKYVLEKDNEFFQSADASANRDGLGDDDDGDTEVQILSSSGLVRLGFITGAVETAKLATLE